jgi:hypothetical protein
MRFRWLYLPLLGVSISLALTACAPDETGNGGDICSQITGYTASTTTPLSFATDIYPILADTNITNGCGQTGICHGNPPGGLDDLFSPTKTLPFIFGPETAPVLDPAMAKAQLMMASVNAPTMQRVVPNNVGASFMAYKIWDKDRKGLACVNAMCVAGASVGDNMPCGDAMPNVGTLDPTNRTKMLDWIAQGAAN